MSETIRSRLDSMGTEPRPEDEAAVKAWHAAQIRACEREPDEGLAEPVAAEAYEDDDDADVFAPNGDQAPDIGAGEHGAPSGWLDGSPMDPQATPGEPMDTTPGVPFSYAGACTLIVGATGGGRSTLGQAAEYDHALTGGRCAYLGSEVVYDEFCARAADLAARRGDELGDELGGHLAQVRYLDLAGTIAQASADPAGWCAGIAERYDLVCIDPLSAVASALNADFDSNAEYLRFHDRLIAPLTSRGVPVILIDNIGHDPDAKARPKGASAKQDRADIILVCSRAANPAGLAIRAAKVRAVRAPFRRGDEWTFPRSTLRIVPRERDDPDTPSTFRPTAIMAKVSAAVERETGLNKRGIRDAVRAKAEHVDLAIRLLIAEGYITTERDGTATRHYHAKPYNEPTASTVSAPCPAPCPDTLPLTVSPCPPTYREDTDTGAGTNGHGNPERVPLLTDALTHSEGPETRKP